MRDGGRVRGEGGAQGRKVGQTQSFQIRGEPHGEFSFAASLVGEAEKFDHDAAGLPFGTGL